MVCVIISLCYLAHSFRMKPVTVMERAVLFNQSSWQVTVLKDQGLSSTFRQALSVFQVGWGPTLRKILLSQVLLLAQGKANSTQADKITSI